MMKIDNFTNFAPSKITLQGKKQEIQNNLSVEYVNKNVRIINYYVILK